ncbi:MAG TPA: AAA family ATPase [Gemmatimonadota bacterium]
MDLAGLIEALSEPAAYPDCPGPVVVHHTHISAVFLAGDWAYKVKKPLDLGFLDFTTPDRRLRSCRDEVRLNRRLAPDVYRGVVPIVLRDGRVRVLHEPVPEAAPARRRPRAARGDASGGEEPIEYAVWMRRLPDEATMEWRLLRGDLAPARLAALARRIAAFHRDAERGPAIARWGRLDVVAGNARENVEQTRPAVGVTVSERVHDRVAGLTEAALAELGPLVEARAARGVPRDTHGDLRLDHVYDFGADGGGPGTRQGLPPASPPGGDGPGDGLVVVDCIEFNERFRYADPVADAAFLAMDLAFYGRRDLARTFVESYLEAAGDPEGARLVPWYVAYRACVRAKVEGFEALDESVPEPERTEALGRARGFWLLALGQLEVPRRRPCLVLIGGLPGTGKSTLARELAARAGFRVVRSDVVRKALAGLPADAPAAAPFGEGIYDAEWTERTYAACLARSERALFDGERVAVDAGFGREARRRLFLEAAVRWGVPGVFLECRARADTVRERLLRRPPGVSDADLAIHQRAAAFWEPPGPGTAPQVVDCEELGAAVDAATAALASEGLLGEA